MRCLTYRPDQASLLPPAVEDARGDDPLCFFLREVGERLELRGFEQGYEAEGRPAYPPALRGNVWWYADAGPLVCLLPSLGAGARDGGVPASARSINGARRSSSRSSER